MQVASRDIKIALIACIVGMLMHWAWERTNFQWYGTPVGQHFSMTAPPAVVQPAVPFVATQQMVLPPVMAQRVAPAPVVSSSAHPITGASQPSEEWVKKNCKPKEPTIAPDGRQIRNYSC